MSGYSFATVAAIAGAVLVAALWVTVLASLVRRTARMPLALTAFSSAWAICCVMLWLRFPQWAVMAGTAEVLISIMLLVPVAQMSLFNDTGSGGEDSDGGGGTRPPDRPTDGGGPAAPSWWPEFEHDLASYVAERERGEREVPVAP